MLDRYTSINFKNKACTICVVNNG